MCACALQVDDDGSSGGNNGADDGSEDNIDDGTGADGAAG